VIFPNIHSAPLAPLVSRPRPGSYILLHSRPAFRNPLFLVWPGYTSCLSKFFSRAFPQKTSSRTAGHTSRLFERKGTGLAPRSFFPPSPTDPLTRGSPPTGECSPSLFHLRRPIQRNIPRSLRTFWSSVITCEYSYTGSYALPDCTVSPLVLDTPEFFTLSIGLGPSCFCFSQR